MPDTPASRLLLEGRRLLIVGAGTRPSAEPDAPPGNGRAIAVTAAWEGAAVACADIDAGSATATAELVRAAGGTAVVVVGDATEPGQSAAVVAEAARELGGLDALVVNAGVGRGRDLDGTRTEDWDAVMALNLRAPFLACKHALPVLDDHAAVVLVGSVAGLRSGTRSPAYDASKAGLFGLCRHAAAEGARRRIRVNVVVPGLIDTPMGRDASAHRASRLTAAARIPLGRQGTPWEVANAVTFLLSSRASFVTGQALVVDGGATI